MRYPVLLHGFTGSSASWEGVIDGLAGAGHAPVLVDLPGHGRHAGDTDADRIALPSALDAVDAAGSWPADLIGYSMGGRVALHFVTTFPGRVRRLVLESSSPGLETETERAARRAADAALAGRLLEEGIAPFVDEWESLPLFESQRRLAPEVLARQRERRLANDPASLAGALRGLGTGALPSLWDRLDDIDVPTLLLAGEHDRKFVEIAERMAERMPGARAVVVADAGHAVHLERPDVWLERVVEFLS